MSDKWSKLDLPGHPVMESKGRDVEQDVAGGRIIRGRNGKPLLSTDALDARHVAEVASEFLGRDIRRVYFLPKNGDRLRQFGLVAATRNGECLSKPESLVVEVLAWVRLRERAPRRKKVVL